MPDLEESVSDEVEIAGRVLQELEPAARDFAARVTGSATHELGEILAGKVRLRRYRSEIKVWTEAKKIAEEGGLPASAVPVKVLTPLLAYAALEDEDDEDMVGRWANLLANAATDSTAEVPPSFPEILRQLEPIDAQILDMIFEKTDSPPANLGPGAPGAWSAQDIETNGNLPQGTVTQSRLENLVRLGLASHASAGKVAGENVLRHTIRLSALGYDFVRACRPPEPPSAS